MATMAVRHRVILQELEDVGNAVCGLMIEISISEKSPICPAGLGRRVLGSSAGSAVKQVLTALNSAGRCSSNTWYDSRRQRLTINL